MAPVRPYWSGSVSCLVVGLLAAGCSTGGGRAGGAPAPGMNSSNSPATNQNTPANTAEPPPVPLCDQPGVICTMVGSGMAAFNGDGFLARQTALYFPLDIAFDPAGNPLVLDWNNLRLRRVNEDNTVITIVGQDFEANPIEGALGTETALHHASDVEITADGVIYLAGNHAPVVFRVGVDNRVQIVAGTEAFGNSGDAGPATEATLNVPYGVALGPDGSLYISDVAESVIRRVDADGVISTFVGNGTSGYSGDGGPATEAQIASPTRMRVDSEGQLYFCDTTNSAIRRVDRDGIVSTIAGTGTSGFTGDGGPAAEAQLATPYDVLIGPSGELYVADTGNGAVRRIDADGVISTVVGIGIPGFGGDGGDAVNCQLDGPSGLALDADGSLWIADTFNNRVRRVAGFLQTRAR